MNEYKETQAAPLTAHRLQAVELTRVEDLDRAFAAITNGAFAELVCGY
jgi:hypothetical protein